MPLPAVQAAAAVQACLGRRQENQRLVATDLLPD